jgi:hypothetical protein
MKLIRAVTHILLCAANDTKVEARNRLVVVQPPAQLLVQRA